MTAHRTPPSGDDARDEKMRAAGIQASIVLGAITALPLNDAREDMLADARYARSIGQPVVADLMARCAVALAELAPIQRRLIDARGRLEQEMARGANNGA